MPNTMYTMSSAVPYDSQSDIESPIEAHEYDYVGLGVGKLGGAASGSSSPVPVGSPVSKGSDFFSIQRAGSTVNFLHLERERASARARENQERE